MQSDSHTDELTFEPEEEEAPYVEYDISVSPSDPTLELLAQQISRGDIIVPFYQRKYVWKIAQASKLIESFLMGLPVPQVFLYVNSEDQLEIIDGQQRLMSVKYFFDGLFGEADHRGRRQVFRLTGLSERSDYNGKAFLELPSKDQRKLRNSTLRAINIKQLKPSKGNDSVFHIFERLNTGGTQLKPQEIRNAVYRGEVVSALKELNDNKSWQKILGLRKPDKNQKDVELVLRLFSLFESWASYEKPMLSFLNISMSANRKFDSDRALRFRSAFTEAASLIDSFLKRPFRPKGVVNLAILESVMIAVMECPSIDGDELPKKYDTLISDPDFSENITGATTDTLVLQARIAAAKRIFCDEQI